MVDTTKTIAAYYRRSTTDQENSIDRQRLAFQTFLKNSGEYAENAEEFIEDGISGDSSVDRPIQGRLLKNIESGKLAIDELFVASTDRWGRFSTAYKAQFTLPLKRKSVALRTPTSIIDFNKPTDDLLYDLHCNLAYIDNHERSAKVTSGIASKALKKTLKLLPCYGLRREGERLVIEEAQTEVVRLIYSKYLETGSKHKVTEYLNNELKVLSPAGKATWNIQTVSKILTNPKLSGHYVYGRLSKGKLHSFDGTALPQQRQEDLKGKEIRNSNSICSYTPDLIEPVIDLATYGKVQQKLIEKTLPKKQREGRRNKFTGLLKCSCGRNMRARYRNGHPVYACPSGKAGGCNGGEYREHLISTAILEVVKNHLLSGDAEKKIGKILQEQDDVNSEDLVRLNDLENKYKVAGARLLDLESCLPDGFREQMRTLKAEIDTIKARVSSCNAAGVDTGDAAKAMAEGYRKLLNGKSDEELLERDTLEQYIADIQLQYVFQRTGSKVFTAIDTVTIRGSLGYDARKGTTLYRSCVEDGVSTLKVRTKVPLPTYFEPDRPMSYSPMI